MKGPIIQYIKQNDENLKKMRKKFIFLNLHVFFTCFSIGLSFHSF